MLSVADSLLADFGIDVNKEEMPKYYKFTSKITGKSVDVLLLHDDIIVYGELRRIIRDTTGEIAKWAIPRNSKQDYIRITPDGKVYGKLGAIVKTKQSSGNYIIQGRNNQNVICSISLLMCMHTSFNFEQFRKIGAAYNQIDISNGLDITTLRDEYHSNYYGRANRKKSGQKDENEGIIAYRHKLHDIKRRCKRMDAYKCITINEDMQNIYEGAKWYKEGCGYRLKSGSQLDIEKDIAGKNEYSLRLCMIVPYYINSYFVGMSSNAGIRQKGLRYQASAREFKTNRKIYIGTFDTPEEAHQAWANFKNKQLQEVVIPYFIEDIFEEDREHPMVLKVLEALRNFKFK